MKKSKELVLERLPEEQLHPAAGYPGYFITKSGRVFSLKELSPMIHSDGYLRVCLYGKKNRKRPGIHQLLAGTFLTKRRGDREVRHLDGNKFRNVIENLEWGTRQTNAADMAEHGSLAGERNPNAKLTLGQVRDIRERYRIGGITRSKLAALYGVTHYCIKRIVENRSWRRD